MQLNFGSHVMTEDPLLDHDLRDLQIVTTAEGVFLYAINGISGGISAYFVTGGRPQLVDSLYHTDATLRSGAVALGSDGASLVLHGSSGDLQCYTLRADGDLSRLQVETLSGVGSAGLRCLTTADLTGSASAVFALTGDGQLQGWRLNGTGEVTRQVDTSGAGFDHDANALLTMATRGGASFCVVADADLGGLAAYRMDAATGALTRSDVFGASDGIAIATPTALSSFTAFGQTWVVVASAGTHSLTLFRLTDTGQLRFADHITDTLASRFAGVTVMETVSIDGQHFVVAAGADDGITILRLLPDGHLVQVTALAHETGLGLENISALELAVIGDRLQIFVASGTEGGVTQLTVDLADLGDQITAAPGRTARGTARDDLLLGAEGGAATLIGGAGDDILVAGADGSRMNGGSGADTFVIRSFAGTVTIEDFNAGVDVLDLSFLDGLRNPQQLAFANTTSGTRLIYGDLTIRLLQEGGGARDIDDIWPLGFSAVDRHGLGETVSDSTLYGTADRDYLRGDEAADRINGQTGDDRIWGGGGRDRLWGSDGTDRIWGEAGGDRLYGGYGEDSQYGGAGADQIWGGQDNDLLQGGNGNDTLYGQFDHDTLAGNAGADKLKGGDGNDQLFGGGDADRLWGDQGADTLHGQNGQDVLRGGTGRDLLIGGAGRDRLFGQAEGDTLKGNAGQDILNGDGGDDRLFGGGGRDRLTGGAGADRFVFLKDHGADRITDFTPGVDLIDLSGLGRRGPQDFNDLRIERASDHILLDTGFGEIRLDGLRPQDLTVDDFIF